MRSCLIVANQTLPGEALAAAIEERLADGPMRAYVVVPLQRVGSRFGSNEAGTHTAAQGRLDDVLGRLRALGVDADGEIGDSDPVQAVRDAIRGREVDEVIVSTLPRGISRWLGEDVPSRMSVAVSVPITVVTQPSE
ncbi:MAG TPA: hypothetical protein VIH00_00775 [Candidatus Limnocylindrales bacterium]